MTYASPRCILLGATMLASLAGPTSRAQPRGPSLAGPAFSAALPGAARLVTTPVDDNARIALTRDVPGALVGSRDQGAVADETALPHIRLALRRPPALLPALDTLTRNDMSKDRRSPTNG